MFNNIFIMLRRWKLTFRILKGLTICILVVLDLKMVQLDTEIYRFKYSCQLFKVQSN